MAKPTVWGLLLAVLALAAAAVEAGSRKGLAADRLDSGLYVQCNSRDPACLQAEVVALRMRLYRVSREYGLLACKHTGFGPTGARCLAVGPLQNCLDVSRFWRLAPAPQPHCCDPSCSKQLVVPTHVVTRHDPLRLPSLSGASLAAV